MIAIMTDFVFDSKIGVMTDPELHLILNALENYAWRMGIYKKSPSLTGLHFEGILGYVGRNIQSGN